MNYILNKQINSLKKPQKCYQQVSYTAAHTLSKIRHPGNSDTTFVLVVGQRREVIMRKLIRFWQSFTFQRYSFNLVGSWLVCVCVSEQNWKF